MDSPALQIAINNDGGREPAAVSEPSKVESKPAYVKQTMIA
jgi:hypothetical protein